MTPEAEGHLLRTLGRIESWMSLHEKKDDERHQEMIRRLGHLEGSVEETGRHELAETRAKVKELEASEQSKKKQRSDRFWDVAKEVGKVALGVIVGTIMAKYGLR